MEDKKIIIITAPSGSGKTTLVKELMKNVPDLAFSISACTRSPRENEVHGKDYYFYSVEEFKNLANKGAFLEWEMVYEGKFYGTLKSECERIWEDKKTPIFDIDVQGAMNLQKQYPHSSLSIFIQAPSLEELRNRLIKRGTETPETLEERINKAKAEQHSAPEFDAIIINDDLKIATNKLTNTVTDFLSGDEPDE